jgi:hypothetical protein
MQCQTRQHRQQTQPAQATLNPRTPSPLKLPPKCSIKLYKRLLMMLLLMLLFQSMQFTQKTFPCSIYCDNYAFRHLHIPFLNPVLQGLNALHTPQLFVSIVGRLPNTLYLYTHTINSTYGDVVSASVHSAHLHKLDGSLWTMT